MKTLDQWFALYSESHKNFRNQAIHKVCVPLIFWSVVSLLWLVPLGPTRLVLPVAVLALVFYFRLSIKSGIFMLIQIVTCMLVAATVQQATGHLLWIASAVFVIAWIGQFVGHHFEGSRPSFLTDLQFLLIGPLWVFKDFLYPKQ